MLPIILRGSGREWLLEILEFQNFSKYQLKCFSATFPILFSTMVVIAQSLSEYFDSLKTPYEMKYIFSITDSLEVIFIPWFLHFPYDFYICFSE